MITGVMSDNGNVAKSTYANYIAFPRLQNNPEVIYCESGNSIPGKISATAHGPCKEYSATPEDFADMIEYLLNNAVDHDILVDFGSTDSETMRSLFIECVGSVRAFDLFIIPTSPDVKQLDTLKTIKFLELQGVPAERIRLVFTIFPARKKLERVFSEIFEAHASHPNFVLDKSAVLYKTLLFDRLSGSGYTVEDMLTDKTDWRQKIIEAHPNRESDEVKAQIKFYTWMSFNSGLATSLMQDFENVFKSTTTPIATTKKGTSKKEPENA